MKTSVVSPNETSVPMRVYLKAGLGFAKAYFLRSNERKWAWFLLLGAVLCVLGLIALNSAFAWWNVIFWSSINTMNLPLYIQSMQLLAVLVCIYCGLAVLKDYLVSTLGIVWLTWMRKGLIDKYSVNYLKLARDYAKSIPDPGTRIESDAEIVVQQSLSLSIDLLQSVLTPISFLGSLWVVGGSLSFVLLGASITIPGYLVWVAILFAGISTYITHKIGGALAKLNATQIECKANFRSGMALPHQRAESVAQDRGDVYYQQSFIKRMLLVTKNAFGLLRVKMRLTAFNSFYQQIAYIFPYMVAAPLYFAKTIDLGQFMQIGYSFQQIQFAFSWFTNAYEPLSLYGASVMRVRQLEQAMIDESPSTTPQSIVIHQVDGDTIGFQELNIAKPSSTAFMMRGLNLRLTRGVNTMIQGPSGLGKSTLFKIVAGTWKYGNGEGFLPKNQKMCFLPQQSVIQNDTLRAVLAYPDPVETYTTEQYEEVLHEMGGMDQFIDRLDESSDWSTELSGGQQQRISFARALLKKPDWLFLDESTASLDAASESQMYHLLQDKLPDTTFISIAHKDSVKQYHHKVLTFTSGENNTMNVSCTPMT